MIQLSNNYVICRGEVLLAQERYDTILRILIEKNTIKVSEIMEVCGVSHETARRDLEVLQENGFAKRVHGGAVLIPQNLPDNGMRFNARSIRKKLHTENLAVAATAAKLINSGDTVFLDAGTTMGYLAENLQNATDLSILTPSIYVINALGGMKNKVICLGGVLSSEEQCFIGIITHTTLSSFYIDKAFISCAGLRLENDALTDYDIDGISRKLIRERAAEMILVMNSDKLHNRAFVEVFSLSGIDTLVVDAHICSEDADAIRQKGINLIIAPLISDQDNSEGIE